MEDFREEIMVELDKKSAQTLREAATVLEEVEIFKKNGFSWVGASSDRGEKQ
jgi:hypothetical protein